MFCCKEMMNYNLNFPPCKKCHRVTSYNLSEQTVSCSSCLCLASNKIGSVNKRPDQLSKTWGDFVWDEELINQYNWLFLTPNKEIIRFFQLPNKWDRLITSHLRSLFIHIFWMISLSESIFPSRTALGSGDRVACRNIVTLSQHCPHPRHLHTPRWGRAKYYDDGGRK